MRLENFRVLQGTNARGVGDLARVPFRTISPQLRNLCCQWDADYCLQMVHARFGSPSYKLECCDGSEAWVWVIVSKHPNNIIYVEAWPRHMPHALYLHCRNWDSAVVDFCLWLTRAHLQRHLQPVQGGKL